MCQIIPEINTLPPEMPVFAVCNACGEDIICGMQLAILEGKDMHEECAHAHAMEHRTPAQTRAFVDKHRSAFAAYVRHSMRQEEWQVLFSAGFDALPLAMQQALQDDFVQSDWRWMHAMAVWLCD